MDKIANAFKVSMKTFEKYTELNQEDSAYIMHDILTDLIKQMSGGEDKVENAKATLEAIEECKADKETNCETCEFKDACKEDEEKARKVLEETEENDEDEE